MTAAGATGFGLVVADASQLIRSLKDEDWDKPSGCPGWTVKDVITHLDVTLTIAIDPAGTLGGLTSETNLESVNDQMVEAKRGLSTAELVASYESQKEGAVAGLAALQAPELAEAEAGLGDVGTYKVHWFADALCFDHYCHLHADILAPSGPVKAEIPPIDNARVAPALDWLVEVIPQWGGAALAKALTAPVDVEFTGVGAQKFQLRPNGTDVVDVVRGASGADTKITSTALEALTWITNRTDRSVAQLRGDETLAREVLAQMNAV